MNNIFDTIAAQYANSPTIVQLIESFNGYVDPEVNFEDFFDFVWNVDTAQGFGLDIWGRIVDVSRELTIPGALTYWGFDEAGDAQPFDQAPFFADVSVTETYTLSDDAYRVLILAKALSNISDSTPASLNRLLQNLFPGRGRCYVVDQGGMSMQFVFEFALAPFELAILTQSGVIPRPAGVSATVFQVDAGNTLGFAQALNVQPFGQGVFFNASIATTPAT